MKPLATSQRVLTWLCLLPPKENTSEWEKRSYVALVLTLAFSASTLFVSSFLFAKNNMSIDFRESLFALGVSLASIPMANSIIVAFFLRHKIPPVFEKLSGFYKKYKDDETFHYLARANNISEWLWDIYLKYIIGGFTAAVIISTFASVLICWYLRDQLDVAFVYHPLKLSLPWEPSWLGYFAEIIYSIVISAAYLLYNGAVLLTFVSICLHLHAFGEIFRHKIRKLDHPNESQNIKDFLHEVIDFHNWVKSLFLETVDVFGLHLMFQLVVNMLMLAIHLFQLDQVVSKQFDIYLCMFLVFVISICISNLFLCCFCGSLASHSYSQLAAFLYDIDWYELPLYLQKYFIIMIANAQISIYYSGYGIITLNLETFSKLMRAVLTYYMMCKTLNAE